MAGIVYSTTYPSSRIKVASRATRCLQQCCEQQTLSDSHVGAPTNILLHVSQSIVESFGCWNRYSVDNEVAVYFETAPAVRHCCRFLLRQNVEHSRSFTL